MSILSQIIAYSPNKIDTETKAKSLLLAEVPRSEMDNFNTPDLEQSPDSFLKPGETLEDFDVTFRRPNAQGGMQQLVQPNADGSRPGYNGKRGPSSKPITFFPKNVQKLIKDYGVKKYYKLDKSGKSMVRQGVNVGVGSGVGSGGPPKSQEMIKFLNYATKNKDTIKDKTITEIIEASGADVGKSNARKRLKENKIKIGTADQSKVIKEVKSKTEKPVFNEINNFAKNWINKNQKKYGVTEYDKFISDFANDWQKELNKPLYKNYGGDRILSNPDGTPKTNTLFGKQETGFTINDLKPPGERTSGLFYKRVFYKNKLKNKDFKKKVNNYLDWVLQDKRGKGNLGIKGGGKSNYLKAAQKIGLDINKDVLYFFGEVMQGDLLTAGEGFYSIVDKEIGGNKASKYKNKLNISYQNWINNIEEVSKLAGVDPKVIINNQLKEAKKMTALFGLEKLPFEFRYAQDHLFGLAEAKALGDPKIAEQTLKNLVASTKEQNYILGTKGFSAKRTALMKKFKNASLENKATIVNQLNTLADEYVPERLQYNVKKDGSLKITNLQPETTFKARTEAYKNLAKTFPKNIKKVLQDFEKHGCGLAAGGRILFSEGTPGGKPTKCAQKGVARFIDDLKKGNYSKATMNLLKGGGNVLKNILDPKELLRLRNLIGPAAMGFMAAFEGGVITDDVVRQGTPLNESLANNWLTKSFLPYTQDYAQAKNLLETGNVPSNMKKYVQDVVTFNEALKDIQGIENRVSSRLVDQGGYGMIDGSSMYSQEQQDKEDAAVAKKLSGITDYNFLGGSAKDLEYKKMLDEMEATRMAKKEFSSIFGLPKLKDVRTKAPTGIQDYMPDETPKDLRPITYMDAEYEDVKTLPSAERKMYEDYFTKKGILQPRQSLSELKFGDSNIYDEVLKDYNKFQRQKEASQYPGYYGTQEPDRFMEGGIASLNVKK
jgi:hypothetical protein